MAPPRLPSRRPRIILRHWLQWMACTPFPIEVLKPAHDVACAIRTVILCSGKSDEENARRILARTFARFAAVYVGDRVAAP